jgi:Clp amino terminal domain, pathogenicity island component
MEPEPVRLQDLIDLVETRQPNGDPLTYVSEAVIVSGEIEAMADDLVDYFVNVAREAGASWAEIGACLGVSKQAAQKKFVSGRERGRAKRGLFMRFAVEARSIVISAQVHARENDDDHIGTEHLILGILDQGESVAAHALDGLGVDGDRVREQMKPGSGAAKGHIPFTGDAKKVLELSLREALASGSRHIQTEHVLLAIVRDPKSSGARLLGRLGVTRDDVESVLLDAA